MVKKNSKKIQAKKRKKIKALFGVFLVLLLSHRFVNIAWTDDFQNDEGFYALVSSAIMHGGRIYEDFRFTQPPLMPYIGAAYMSLVGVGLVQLRFLAILSSVLVSLCLYFIVRETFTDDKKVFYASFLSVLPLAVFTLVNSVSRVYYIEPFITFVSSAAVYMAMKKTRNSRVLSGFLCGSALLLKLWAIPTLAAVLLHTFWTSRRDVKYVLLGFFIVMIPFFFYLSLSEKAVDYILFQASRGRWTFMQKTKPLWSFYRALSFISIASIPVLYAKKHRLVFLWTLSTFIFFYTLMPDAVSHHTYFMAPVFTLSAAVFTAGFSPKKIWFWVLLILVLYSIAEKRHIDDIRFKMTAKGTKLTQVAQYVEANTNPSDTILSDYAMITFISKRRQAGYILDTSEAAIFYDLLTSKDLIEVSEREKPKYVIVESRFKNPKLADFMAYVSEKYVQETPDFYIKPFEVYRRKD